jgi:organic hydroperoxide reductase OsmC/OhrA
MDPAATITRSSRVHHYSVRCAWEGSTGVGYERYVRDHRISAPPAAPTLELSSDPAFRGDPARLNPEQLLVMAASSCQLLAFLAVAARARLDVVSYEDHGEAEMPEDDLPVRITTIRLRPRITLTAGIGGAQATDERVRQLVQLAHQECFIANSLRTEVTVTPEIIWRAAAA